MSPEPTLPFAGGPEPIGAFVDPVLADPSPSLLTAVIEAYREAAPELVDPDPATLRAAEPGSEPDAAAELPTLTVLASDGAVDAVADRFRPASRLAALAEAGVWDLLTLSEPQPNAALVGRETGCALVAAEGRGASDGGATGTPRWCRVGDDPTLRERYAPLVEAAEERRLRTPSRRRVYEAVRERCDVAVADDVIRALDAEVGGGDGSGDGDTDDDGSTGVAGVAGDADKGDALERDASKRDALDLAGARRRAYVVGVHRGALDRDLRRACEDAGLGSSATFTRIKRELREAGLLGTESVPQPVGRPRERLVARGALAEADGPVEAVAAVAAAAPESV